MSQATAVQPPVDGQYKPDPLPKQSRRGAKRTQRPRSVSESCGQNVPAELNQNSKAPGSSRRAADSKSTLTQPPLTQEKQQQRRPSASKGSSEQVATGQAAGASTNATKTPRPRGKKPSQAANSAQMQLQTIPQFAPPHPSQEQPSHFAHHALLHANPLTHNMALIMTPDVDPRAGLLPFPSGYIAGATPRKQVPMSKPQTAPRPARGANPRPARSKRAQDDGNIGLSSARSNTGRPKNRLAASDIDSGEDSDFFAALDYTSSAPEATALPPPPTAWLDEPASADMVNAARVQNSLGSSLPGPGLTQSLKDALRIA